MSNSLASAILSTIGQLPFEDVPVPEFGEDVVLRVSVMTGAQREQMSNAWRKQLEKQEDKTQGFGTMVLIFSTIDTNGNLVFSPEHFNDIGKLHGAAVQRVINASLKINKMLTDSIETEEKN